MTISTLRAIFEGCYFLIKVVTLIIGRKDLFTGLSIDEAKNNEFWRKFEDNFAVITLDMSYPASAKSPEIFKSKLQNLIIDEASQHKIKIKMDEPDTMLRKLVISLSAKYRGTEKSEANVVILVDEYDAPLNDKLGEKYLEEIHAQLSGFYGVFKTLDRYLYYVFVTGISKYAQSSIFSGNYTANAFITVSRNE